MNNYREFKNYQCATYDRLKTKSRKPIVRQCNDYLDYCQNVRQMSRCTLKSKVGAYKFLIKESMCDDLRNLTNAAYDKFVKAELERGVSARTINTRMAHIVAMVKYYRETGMCIPLRVTLIPKLKELPPRRVSYTREQIENVLENCPSDLQWLLIRIAFDTGMRITELKNLSVEQLSGRKIRFIGKGRKDRIVYIAQETLDRLNRYIKDNNIKSGTIWLNDWGYPMSSGTLRIIMREAFCSCGYSDFYPHALRHSFGTDIQRQGADIMVIKEMMGHSNVTTTQKYLHGLDNRLEEMFEKYRG